MILEMFWTISIKLANILTVIAEIDNITSPCYIGTETGRGGGGVGRGVGGGGGGVLLKQYWTLINTGL